MDKKVKASSKTEPQDPTAAVHNKLVERLNLATHAAQMGIWDWDILKNELVWDDQMYRLYGLQPGDFSGAYEAWLDGVHPDDRAASDAETQQSIRGEKEYETEFRVLWRDGSVHWLKANGQVFRDEEGKPIRMVGVNYDITARKQTEERLKESEEYLRLGYEAGDLGIWKNDLQTGAVEFDERARIHYGFDTRHTTLLEVTKHIHPDDLARVGSEIEAATAPHGSGKFATEYRVIHADGSVHWLAIGVQVLFEGEGAERHAVVGYGTTQDITERKRVDEALRFSQLELQEAQSVARVGSWKWNIQTSEITWSDEMYDIFGIGKHSYTGRLGDVISKVIHPDDLDIVLPSNVAAIANEPVEYRIILPDESIRHIWAKSGEAILDNEGKTIFLTGIAQDITERKRTEEELRESERQFRGLFASSPVAIYLAEVICDAEERPNDLRFLYVNPVFERFVHLKAADLVGRTAFELFPQGNRATIERQGRVALTGIADSFEGFSIPLNAYFETTVYSPRHGQCVTFLTDITERKRAEKQIVQMKRLYATLSQVNQTIVRVTDRADLYQSICDVSTKFGEFALAWIGLLNAATGEVVPVAASGLDLAQWPFPPINLHEGIFQNGLVGNAFRTSTVITSEDIQSDERTRSSQTALTNFDYHAAAIVPFQLRGKTIGVLSLVSHDAQLFKAQEEVLLLKEMGGDISFALDAMETESVRRQAEDSLKESETRFSKVFFTNPVSQSVLSIATGQVVEVNDACCNLYEYPRGELIGTDPAKLDLWANPAEQSDILEELQRTGRLLPREVTIRPKSGKIRTILFSVEQISWKGEICLITSSVDITERKRAEAKFKQQLEQLNGLHTIDLAISSSLELESTLNVILQQVQNLLKADAVSILLFNPASQTLEHATSQGFRSAAVSQSQIRLGEGLAGQVGLSREFLHIPDLVQIGEKFLRAEMLKQDQFLEYLGVPLIAKDTLKGVLEIFHRTPLNPDAEWLNFFNVIGGQAAIAIENAQLFEELQRSNTELEQRVKLRTADLSRVNAELEHASRTKDEFLANMSHELRTPLTGILGFTEALQFNTYGQVNEKQFKALQNIDTSGRHLLELINDILDLAKIEAGKFDIYPEMISIEDICRTSLMFVKEQASTKSIDLEYQLADNAKSVFADPRRLKQILVNLLSNAVKFTPEKGQVRLSVQTDSEKGQLHFSVTDTGIGIAQKDMDRLFTPFTQVDSRLNRQYEGTGLGLVLILRLAEMHGGNVQVESQVGTGSRFTVSLPWQSQASAQPQRHAEQAQLQTPEENTPNSRGVLLLAEDSQTNILAMGDYLQFKGYTLVIASNGMEALVKAEEHQPQLILMDIQMPVMDGLEATRRLRADPRFATTPIIALTALAMTGDRERCLQAGANDYMSKPVVLKELAGKIDNLLQKA